MLYRVTHQVSDYILLILIWECLHAKPILPDLHNSARFAQFCQICSCPSRIMQTSELPNQSKQNVISDLMSTPVQVL